MWWFKKKEENIEEMAGSKKSTHGSRGDQTRAGRKAKLEEERERRRRKKKEKEEKKAKEKKISAQNTIPYREMAKDGTCRGVIPQSCSHQEDTSPTAWLKVTGRLSIRSFTAAAYRLVNCRVPKEKFRVRLPNWSLMPFFIRISFWHSDKAQQ